MSKIKKEKVKPKGKTDIDCAIQSLEYAQKYIIDTIEFIKDEKDIKDDIRDNAKRILKDITSLIGSIYNIS